AGAVDVEVDLLVAALVLQVQQLLDGDVGQVVGDRRVAAGLGRAAQKDDAVLQQQVGQGHLPLPGVVAVALAERGDGRPGVQVEHGGVPLGRGHGFVCSPPAGADASAAGAGEADASAGASGGGAVGSFSSPSTACSSTVATPGAAALPASTSSYSAFWRTKSRA